MATARRVVLALGPLAIAGIGVFPPWTVFEAGRPSKSVDAGYRFVLRGPALPSDAQVVWSSKHQRFEQNGAPLRKPDPWVEEFDRLFPVSSDSFLDRTPRVLAARINYARLRLQVLIVVALFGATALVLPAWRVAQS